MLILTIWCKKRRLCFLTIPLSFASTCGMFSLHDSLLHSLRNNLSQTFLISSESASHNKNYLPVDSVLMEAARLVLIINYYWLTFILLDASILNQALCVCVCEMLLHLCYVFLSVCVCVWHFCVRRSFFMQINQKKRDWKRSFREKWKSEEKRTWKESCVTCSTRVITYV